MYFSNTASLVACISLVIGYVNADVAITAPMNNVWQAGSSQFITWTDNANGKPMAEKFDITLMSGAMTTLQQVGTIATAVSSSSGQYKWDIPGNTATGSQYAIRIGVGSVVAYSPYFTILASGSSIPSVNSNSSTTPGSSSNPTPTTKSTGNMVNPVFILTYFSVFRLVSYL
ncbi:hypothetical protein K7432_001920 [Basidiobolus ranarum]|uniref:Yeast cell wall synthesis Kre9/Knh1-like N-terminal domain-containing protein n=1 Tax=Basidiobolus ranarum TaxID=34480 RepID=A0ABR2W8N6_9FUNG